VSGCVRWLSIGAQFVGLAGALAAPPEPPAVLPIAHRLAEYVPQLVGDLTRVAPVLGVTLDAAAAERCGTVAWDGVCTALGQRQARRAARGCRRVLSQAAAGLARVPVAADDARAATVAALERRISTEAFRLSSLLRHLSHAGCAPDPQRAADEPVALMLLDGGPRVLVEPERGLDPRRAYVLRSREPPYPALAPVAEVPSLPEGAAFEAARALLAQFAARAGEPASWPAFPAFMVMLPEPPATIPFWHAPVGLTRAAPATPGAFRPRDPRPAITVTPADGCGEPAEAAADGLPADAPRDELSQVRRGALASGVSYWIALPRRPVSGVVILAHSLEWNARIMLATLANDLAREGLASASFDLPLHGERLAAGEEFVPANDPAAFARHAEAAARDVVALADYLRRCPESAGLPRAASEAGVAFLGYSIGATVGVLALAVDPLLRPAVLIAPAGDVFRWQGLLVAREVGLLTRTCVGALGGKMCTTDADCGAGICEHHPGLWLVPTALGPTARVLVGDAEPLGMAAFLGPPDDTRPVLVQLATADAIVFRPYARRVADALALVPVTSGADLPPRAVTEWPGGHDFIHDPAVRLEAARFLARYARAGR